MLNSRGLHTLLDLDISTDAPRIVIYSDAKTERLEYTCRFIFNHVLKVNYTLVDQPEEFENAAGFKLNYSKKAFEKIAQIIPHSLLFEKGVSKLKPEGKQKDGNLYFFETLQQKDDYLLPYDIFAAVFYFISRYEEWQTFKPDHHQRFEAAESILFTSGFYLKPVADIWIRELNAALQKFYPSLKFPGKKMKVISTIDVDNLYAYKSKGIVRILGACAKDVLKADFKNLKERFLVLRGKKDDPFDIYETISDFCFEHRIPLIYFFLFKTGTKYDRTVNPKSSAYESVLATLKKNHALIGLHPSYHSYENSHVLNKEITDLSSKSGETINFSRQHFLRFNIKTTPHFLMQNGIIADFTMGFASSPGFRAGTSHPFFYFDLNTEKQTELLFVPFCAMDGAYTIYKNTPTETALQSLNDLAAEVKKTGGLFITVFHERTFSDHLYQGFGTLYKNLHLGLKES